MAATQTASTDAQGRFGKVNRMSKQLADSYMARRSEASSGYDSRLAQSLTRTAQGIGAAVITIAIIAIVANAVLTTNVINNTSGPFSPVVDQLGTTGVAAIGLLIVALIVAAARVIMSMMSGGF